MRARHRHFNSRFAGAALVLDSRHITGLSNGASVATWSDRSGNARDCSQSNQSSRPTYQTAVQAGQPIIRFNSANNNELRSPSFANATSASAVMVAAAVNWTGAGAYRPICGHGYTGTGNTTTGISFAATTPGASQDWQANDIIAIGSGFPSTRTPRAVGAATSGSNFRIISTVLGSNTARISSNGARISTRVETTGSCASFIREFNVGSNPGNTGEFWNGDIAQISYFMSELNNSLRRRLEHAAAYSFKIACS